MIKITRIAPEIPVGNMADAKAYYHEKLGFETVFEMPQGDYVIVERFVAIHLFTTSDKRRPVSIHLFVEGIDELHDELRKRGATIIQAVEKKPWGTRDFRVTDPNGNILIHGVEFHRAARSLSGLRRPTEGSVSTPDSFEIHMGNM